MAIWRIFYDDESGEDCEVEELSDLGVDGCMNRAEWTLEQGDDNIRLCTTHKTAAKDAGLAR